MRNEAAIHQNRLNNFPLFKVKYYKHSRYILKRFNAKKARYKRGRVKGSDAAGVIHKQSCLSAKLDCHPHVNLYPDAAF